MSRIYFNPLIVEFNASVTRDAEHRNLILLRVNLRKHHNVRQSAAFIGSENKNVALFLGYDNRIKRVLVKLIDNVAAVRSCKQLCTIYTAACRRKHHQHHKQHRYNLGGFSPGFFCHILTTSLSLFFSY